MVVELERVEYISLVVMVVLAVAVDFLDNQKSCNLGGVLRSVYILQENVEMVLKEDNYSYHPYPAPSYTELALHKNNCLRT